MSTRARAECGRLYSTWPPAAPAYLWGSPGRNARTDGRTKQHCSEPRWLTGRPGSGEAAAAEAAPPAPARSPYLKPPWPRPAPRPALAPSPPARARQAPAAPGRAPRQPPVRPPARPPAHPGTVGGVGGEGPRAAPPPPRDRVRHLPPARSQEKTRDPRPSLPFPGSSCPLWARTGSGSDRPHPSSAHAHTRSCRRSPDSDPSLQPLCQTWGASAVLIDLVRL